MKAQSAQDASTASSSSHSSARCSRTPTGSSEEKRRKDLGEAAIGQIDTGSFMLKLVLLGGFRGVAANVLWTRAEELKREQDWDRMKATVDLITKLQPHFLSVWTFQGWNLAYNVSVEWDAPEDKYEWIKKGIKFLQDGVQKNRQSPDLIWDTAWTYYHKIGFADEAIILRRLFRDDDDEEFKTYTDYSDPHQPLIVGNDNFKLGYGWFSRSVDLVDEGATRLVEGTRDVDLHRPVAPAQGTARRHRLPLDAAHAQTRYAAGLEKMSTLGIPATFGEVAKNEWARALQRVGQVRQARLHDAQLSLEQWQARTRTPVQLDDATNPERFAKLTDNQKYWANRWADQMNYRYWKDRRRRRDDHRRASRRGSSSTRGRSPTRAATSPRPPRSSGRACDIWEELLKDHRDYRNDEFNKKDTGLIVLRYVRALKHLGEPEPEDLPFRELLKGVEDDYNVDPFDANEMLGPTGISEGASPAQDQGQGQRQPPPAKGQAK